MVVPVSDVSDQTLILYPITFRHLLFQIRVVSTGYVVSCLVTVLFPLDPRSSADRLSSHTIVTEEQTRRPKDQGQIPGGAETLIHGVQTGLRIQTIFRPVCRPVDKAKLLEHEANLLLISNEQVKNAWNCIRFASTPSWHCGQQVVVATVLYLLILFFIFHQFINERARILQAQFLPQTTKKNRPSLSQNHVQCLTYVHSYCDFSSHISDNLFWWCNS